MSEVMLNIVDAARTIHGKATDILTDIVIASLTAEPETLAELEAACRRWIKPDADPRPLSNFREGLDEEPWDAGLVVIDLPSRLIVSDSSLTLLTMGQMLYREKGPDADEVWLPYRLPDDWAILPSLSEYNVQGPARVLQRSAPPIDARAVFYGDAMIEFLVNESLAAYQRKAEGQPTESVEAASDAEDDYDLPANPIITGIHAKWLMTPRADLGGQTPRQLLVAKQNFIDFDLQHREQQWSILREGPPALPRESFAYRNAGFGTHEFVIYYDLIRHLLEDCWSQIEAGTVADPATEVARLKEIQRAWLESPGDDFTGKIPAAIIESERRRAPLAMSAESMIVDEHCEFCQMMADESLDWGPGFSHLDSAHFDSGFAFSSHITFEEWEKEERSRREFNEDFNRRVAAGEFNKPDYDGRGFSEDGSDEDDSDDYDFGETDDDIPF